MSRKKADADKVWYQINVRTTVAEGLLMEKQAALEGLTMSAWGRKWLIGALEFIKSGGKAD